MILAISANPSIDNTVYVDGFALGALNRITKKVVSLGGKGMNVAIAAKRLGFDSYLSGFMFEEGSKRFSEKLDSEGVPFSFTMCEGSVRINTKVISSGDMSLTEINDSGNPVGYNKQFDLMEKIRDFSSAADFTVFSGSLPPDIGDDFYYRAGLNCSEKSKVAVDAEGDRLFHALKLNPFLVKVNLTELEKFTKIKIDSIYDIQENAKKIVDLGAENVLISAGSHGAVLLNEKEGYFAKAPQVYFKSTVGAGDSMLAAALGGYINGYCQEAVLKCAVTAGTAAVMGEGTDLLTGEQYERLYPLVETKRIF